MNMLSNAAKFSPSGATVDVSVQTIDEMVHVEIKDVGTTFFFDLRPSELPGSALH